eukprot:149232-Prorocentrum_minimum.AAC.1
MRVILLLRTAGGTCPGQRTLDDTERYISHSTIALSTAPNVQLRAKVEVESNSPAVRELIKGFVSAWGPTSRGSTSPTTAQVRASGVYLVWKKPSTSRRPSRAKSSTVPTTGRPYGREGNATSANACAARG